MTIHRIVFHTCVVLTSDARNMTKQTDVTTSVFLARSRGQMSRMLEMRFSTPPNSESMPSVKHMRKKRQAQSCETGRWLTSSG